MLAAACAFLSACASDTATEEATPVAPAAPNESTTTTEESTTTTTTTEEATTTTAAPDLAEGPGCAALTPGQVSIVMESAGASYDVRIFIPPDFDGANLPAVVNWHGLGSSGPEQATYSGYETVAGAEGFIVVHPTGIPTPGTSQNSWELIDAQDPTRDDVAFAVDLFDALEAQWCVDGDRIFSTGMSNGGFFTARLVCEIPERLAGAISVAGVFHPEGCEPSEAVPFLAFHGTDDDVVPFDGSGESVLVEDGDAVAAEFFSQVMPDEFAEFAADFGCGPATTTEVSPEVIRYDYPGCGVEMSFFEVTGGGHTWPDSPLAALTAVLGYTTTDVSATEDGWAFFDRAG